MSATAGPGLPGSPTTLFDHALRLHRLTPGKPLARNGEPYPDDGRHRGRREPRAPVDRSLAGQDAALILDAHFAQFAALPGELADAFHDVYVPSRPNDHIAAAAERADRERVRRTGRWLVRHGTDRCAVTVGLALLAAMGTAADIPLIQTIGLLSHRFGPLAVRALESQQGGVEALLWLAERVTGWGRVHVVDALCRFDDDPVVRAWLLRRACDGDLLNGYFAGKVATVTRLHEELGALDHDHEMVDHIGRLLHVMSGCRGMGRTLALYPHAGTVLEAHARHAGSLRPTIARYFTLAVLTQHLTTESPEAVGCTAAQQETLRATYGEILDREEWTRTARAGIAADDRRMRWLADYRAPQLRLRAFPDREPGTGEQPRRGS
ncbi:hypothetical protein [Streptomyces sp. cg40]|uniref:hypothetical protein n=1 Tax=Streptomyces sp. cg40 TaxID=3419764 RepID=UPI003D081572